MSRNLSPQTRVRFAPSPTGALHLGGALIAISNLVYARANGGSFALRIDDTDAARSTEHNVNELFRLLRWLGVEWDEGPIRQQERASLYHDALNRLYQNGDAYPCFCGEIRLEEMRKEQAKAGLPPRYDGTCRKLSSAEADELIAAGAPHVIRFKVQEGRDILINDLVKGEIEIPFGAFGDPILRRADGSAGYLLATVVDDGELKISHIIRGEDHLTNSAVQTLLFEALGYEVPHFAHLPLLRSESGKKLSKRDPMGTLDELVDEGFLPTTVRRYLWELLHQGAVDPLKQIPLSDLDFSAISAGSPMVDRQRIESLGREDMADLPLAELLEGVSVLPSAEIEPLIREVARSNAAKVAMRGELSLIFEGPGEGDLPFLFDYVIKDDETRERWQSVIEIAVAAFGKDAASVSDLDSADQILAQIKDSARAKGIPIRDAMQALRVVLTGSLGGPALPLIMDAIGRDDTYRRLETAYRVLHQPSLGGGVIEFG